MSGADFQFPSHAAVGAALAASWQLLAHVSQLPVTGAIVAGEAAGRPLLAVRGADGAIRVFHNACRHRLGPLAEDGMSQCKAGELVCRYHGWRYGLDGRLKAAVDFGAGAQLDASKLGLIALETQVWRGFVFAALSDKRPDFADWIAPLAARLEGTPLETWRFAAQRTHRIACRFAVYAENYLEGYHIKCVHPALDAEIDSSAYEVTLHGRIAVHRAPLRAAAAGAAVYDGLWAFAFPNLGINVYRDGLMMERMSPEGPSVTRLDYFYVFADPNADLCATFAMSDAVTAEDKTICEAVERNMAAGAVPLGPLSARHENAVAAFRAWMAGAP